jgi:ATP-dependent DNA helicase RecQ
LISLDLPGFIFWREISSAGQGDSKTSTEYDFIRANNRELESRPSISARMFSALHRYFGYTSFRPLQEEIIRDVLERKDVFVLMPTGGGKSMCYQLPALLMEGVTIVVSPLISLMKDQVDGLEANGIAAACMNSTQSAREIRDVKTAFLENRLKVLYIAPERLMMPGTFAFLKKGKVSLFAIDEAHCISEWGHDFRPEYRKLKLLRDTKTGFPDIPVIALTATATERVREDIISQLNLNIAPEKGPYVASFDRKNLYYEIRPKKETFSEITDYLHRHRGEAGIIYCQSRNSVEALTKKLNLAGFKALPYHAGLSDFERTRNQEMFIKDDVDIIVATIAFGMGIDKSNVRFVIHYDLPRNLESYYQETGRGGRDRESM